MKNLLLVAGLWMLMSCGGSKPQPVVFGDIFDKKAAELAMHTNLDKRAQADDLFKKGETELRKKKQPFEAIELFSKSLLAYPAPKVYFELGNAYMESRQYEEAIKAYAMAEAFDYKPLSRLLYNTACAHSLDGNKYEAGKYLEYAIESGYSNSGHMISDKDLATPEYGFAYDDAYLDAMSGSADEGELLWTNFKKAFAALTFPFTIDKQTDKVLLEKKGLSYRFDKFVSEMHNRAKFSRQGGISTMGYAMVANTEDHTTVIYATLDEMEESPASYWMVSYNAKGEQVAKMNIAGQQFNSPICKVFTINEDLSFQVKDFKLTYEKPLEDVGFYENKVLNTELTDTKEYKIADDGKFIEVPPALGMR